MPETPSNERPRRATPRPIHAHSTRVRGAEASAHLWGDAPSGFVSDRIFTSSDVLHVLEYTIAPRGRFVHSATNPTVFAADVTYIVIEGELVIAEPEHGEVRRVRAGELVFYRRDTWHHAFNRQDRPVRVLEFFAPPPSRGTASTYAKRQPLLESISYEDRRWSGRWPEATAEAASTARLHHLRPDDLRWRIVDDHARHMEGLAVDTEHLTVHHGELCAGYRSDELLADDETFIYVDSGVVHVHVPDAPSDARAWWRLEAGDGFYLAANDHYRLVETDGAPATYWIGSARPVSDDWTPDQ